MTTTSKILAFTSVSFKTSVSSLVVLGLVGCDGLARFNTKKDAPPADPVVAEESIETAVAADSAPSAETEAKPEKDKKLASPLYEWKGDGRSITRIVVNTNEQKARFYSGNEEIGWSTVATGLSKYPTPTGRFQVTEKVENKRSNLYGKVYGKGGRVLRSNVKVGRDPIPDGGRFEGAHMPFFMRLTDDGIGLHAGPIPNPGQPASHGCIRMPSKIAPVVFRHVSSGTPVTIEGKGPNYGDYVARQRAEAARRAEARRIAEEKRAAEAKQAQQVAQATSEPEAADEPKTESNANAEKPESHAVAKDEAAAAAQKLDATNARETRMREPTQSDTPARDADTSAALPETAPAKPTEQTSTPTPETAKPAATDATEQRPSIIEEAAPTAPAGEPRPAAREGIGELGSRPAAVKTPSEAPSAPAASDPVPAKPAPEIQEAPAPAPKPAERAAEASASAPEPAPAPKPAEPAPSPAPAASPQPSAAPAAAPADSAAE